MHVFLHIVLYLVVERRVWKGQILRVVRQHWIERRRFNMWKNMKCVGLECQARSAMMT